MIIINIIIISRRAYGLF